MSIFSKIQIKRKGLETPHRTPNLDYGELALNKAETYELLSGTQENGEVVVLNPRVEVGNVEIPEQSVYDILQTSFSTRNITGTPGFKKIIKVPSAIYVYLGDGEYDNYAFYVSYNLKALSKDAPESTTQSCSFIFSTDDGSLYKSDRVSFTGTSPSYLTGSFMVYNGNQIPRLEITMTPSLGSPYNTYLSGYLTILCVPVELTKAVTQ